MPLVLSVPGTEDLDVVGEGCASCESVPGSEHLAEGRGLHLGPSVNLRTLLVPVRVVGLSHPHS